MVGLWFYWLSENVVGFSHADIVSGDLGREGTLLELMQKTWRTRVRSREMRIEVKQMGIGKTGKA
jgi:hypothetical protein